MTVASQQLDRVGRHDVHGAREISQDEQTVGPELLKEKSDPAIANSGPAVFVPGPVIAHRFRSTRFAESSNSLILRTMNY